MLNILTYVKKTDESLMAEYIRNSIFRNCRLIHCASLMSLDFELSIGGYDSLYIDSELVTAGDFSRLMRRYSPGSELEVVLLLDMDKFRRLDDYAWYAGLRCVFSPLDRGPFERRLYTTARVSNKIKDQPAEIQLQVLWGWSEKPLINRFWEEVIGYPDKGPVSKAWFEAKCREYGVRNIKTPLLPVVINLSDWDVELRPKRKTFYMDALFQIMRKNSPEPQGDYAFMWQPGSILWILNSCGEHSRENVMRLCEGFIADLQLVMGMNAVLAVGEPVEIEGFIDMLDELNGISKTNLARQSKIVFLADKDAGRSPAEMPKTEEAAAFAVAGRRTEAKNSILSQINTMAEDETLDSEKIFRFQLDFLQNLFCSLSAAGTGADSIFLRRKYFLDQMDMAGRSYESLRKWISWVVDVVCDHVSSRVQPETLHEKVKLYVNDNIYGDLSRKAIAANLFVSESQLAHSFKLGTGMSLSQYVNKQRLEHSRQLLAGTDESIMSIASHLGFSSASYYSRLFSEEYGCTPMRYRESRRRASN